MFVFVVVNSSIKTLVPRLSDLNSGPEDRQVAPVFVYIVVVCTGLSGKEKHTQVGVDLRGPRRCSG